MKPEQIEELSVDLGTTFYRRQSLKWISELKRVKSFKDFINISPVSRPIRKLLEKSLTLSYYRSWFDNDQEVKEQLGTVSKDLQNESEKIHGFDQAIAYLKNKRIIPPDVFRKASAEIKAISFSVQRIEKLNALIAIQDSIKLAIARGYDFKFWKQNLNFIFEAYGITPLSPHHVKTVFRTNIHSVYNIGHRQASLKNRFVTHMQLMVIVDSRTTEDICLPLAGITRPKTDPIWNRITPLNHYNCRSRTRPLVKRYMDSKNINETGALNESQQQGFNDVQGDFQRSPLTLSSYNKKLQKQAISKQNELRG